MANAICVSISLLLPSILYAESSFVCDGRLEKFTNGQSVYFTPIDFNSLRLIPTQSCSELMNCEYDFVASSGKSKKIIFNKVQLDNLCEAVSVSNKPYQIDQNQVETENSDDFETIFHINRFNVSLHGFSSKLVNSTEFNISDENIKITINAVSVEYSFNDFEANNIVSEGENNASEEWHTLVRTESVTSYFRAK